MKINLTLKEAKLLLNCIYGHQGIANMYPEMPKPDSIEKTEPDTTDEIKILSDSDVHQSIVEMCLLGSVSIYINYARTYTTDNADYDNIAELLYPYDGEIVSIYSLGKDANKRTKYFINTL